MGEFANRLGRMKETWEGSADDSFGASIPAGIYTMQLQAATLGESQSSGRLQIHREHLVVGGEHDGEVQHDYMQLETARGPNFVRQWLRRMGVEPPNDPADLEDVVAELSEAAPYYRAQVKQNGDFTNVSVLKRLEEDEVESGGSASAGADDDPEPNGEDGPGEPAGEDDERVAELLAFAQSQDVEVDEDMDEDDLIKAIDGYEWDEEVLDTDEIALLKDIGATFEKPKPKPPVRRPARKKASKKKTSTRKRK